MSDRDVTRARYLDALLATYGMLRLPIRSGEQFLPLQTIFQPLRLRSGSFSFTEEAEEGTDPTRIVRNGTEALAQSSRKRMVVLGGPGMGKTTLLKALLQQAIHAAQNASEAPLPIFISLPDLARSGLTLATYLPAILTALDIDTRYAETLVEAIEQGRAFLCLDSLDEVVPAQRPDIIALIDREAARCAGTWIIGSRFTEYKGGQFVQGQFAEWELQPLDEEMRLELAKHLLPVISQLLQQPSPPDAEAFITVLDNDTRLAEWGTNPLLFSLAAIVYTQAGMLPGCRAALYRDIIEIMLSSRISDQQARAELRTILADISLQLYQTRGRNFTIPELFELFATRYPSASYQTHSAMIARILDAGLLDVVAHQTYGFKHQMFQEYLAAVALATQLVSPDETVHANAWDFIWRKHTYSRWREILRLCVGVLVQEFGHDGSQVAIRWLYRLIAERDTPDGDVGNLCLELALGSLREFSSIPATSELAETAQMLVLTWAKLRVKQDNNRIQKLAEDIKMLDLHLVLPTIIWLEQVREHGYQDEDSESIYSTIYSIFSDIEINTSNGSTSPIGISARVFALAYPNSQGISLYASMLPTTLQTRAAQESVAKLLQDTMEHWRVRVGAVALLRKWKEPIAIDALCKVLENATNYYVLRTAAAEALGEQGKLMPIARLIPLLQDKDERVCGAVVDALIEEGQHIPIEPFLALLRENEVWYIRKSILEAFEQLGELADIAPELLLHLLEDTSSENATKRTAALYLLGNRTPIEQLLIAIDDPSWQVSYAALCVACNMRERFPTAHLLDFLSKQNSPTHSMKSEETHKTDYKITEMLCQPERIISREEFDLLLQKNDTLEYALTTALAHHIALPLNLLLNALNQGYPITNQAASVLASMGANAPLASLLEVLWHGSSEAQLKVAEILYTLSAHIALEQEPILLHLQKLQTSLSISPYHGGDTIRKVYDYLVRTLMRAGATIPVELLLNALKAEINSDEKDVIVIVLAEFGTQTPLEKLLHTIVDDRLWGSEKRTISVLSQIYTRITPQILQTTSQQHRIEDAKLALHVLRAMDKEVPVELIKNVLDDTNRDCYLRMEARYTLHAAGVHLPLPYFLAELGIGHESYDYVTVESTRTLGPQAPIRELLNILVLNYDGIEGLNYDGLEIQSLLVEWEHNDPWVRSTVIKALRTIAPYVPLEPLLAALNHSHALVHEAALHILGAFGERAPIDKLIAYQEKHGTTETLWETFTELHEYIPQEALAAALYGFNREMKYNLFWTLKTWGHALPLEPLLALANNHEYEQREDAIAALGWLQDRAPLDFLLTLLKSEDEGEALSAARALSRMGPYAPLDILLVKLYNDDGDMSVDMIDIFGEMGEYAPFDIILQALDNENPDVREHAEYALRDLVEDAPAKFVEVTRDDRRTSVREAQMQAIAKLGKDAPLELVIAALNDERGRVSFYAWRTLLELDVDPALLPLELMLTDLHENNASYEEMELLAKMGPRVPAEPLLALLGDSDLDTCTYAAKALYQTHPEEFVEVARQAEAILRGEPTGSVFASRVQSRIADRVAAIGRATPAVLEMITDLLDWPYWEVRVKAAKALEEVHRNIPDRAIRHLLELRHDPESQAVREAADDALAEILSRESGMEDE